MKQILLIVWMFSILTVWSQQSVRLSIDHQLSGAAFGSTVTAQNDLGHDFRTERLQFYLSQIELVHDGGQTTPVPNTWFLVDANVPFDESLGSFSVGTLEAIRFGVGVEQAANHLDPASYAMTHPLAPKNPSMHWGWQSGYRFVCMEGKAGSALDKVYEVHALGDNNYKIQQITTTGLPQGSDLVVSLTADYAKALEGVDINSGLIRHGTSGEAVDLLDNFALKVFTSHEGNASVLSTEPSVLEKEPQIYPNPSVGILNIDHPGQWAWQLFDLTGREAQSGECVRVQDGPLSLDIRESGVYLFRLIESDRQIYTRKIIVH